MIRAVTEKPQKEICHAVFSMDFLIISVFALGNTGKSNVGFQRVHKENSFCVKAGGKGG